MLWWAFCRTCGRRHLDAQLFTAQALARTCTHGAGAPHAEART